MSKNKVKTACVLMVGPDVQMDQFGEWNEPVNPLPIKCSHCTFRDIDFVAKPYLLGRGISAPTELTLAVQDNFLVRDRVRSILECAVPNACSFHPTADRKSRKPAPWWLAVPRSTLETPVPEPVGPFCSRCGQPKCWKFAVTEVWEQMRHYDSGGVDVFKPRAWRDSTPLEDAYQQTNAFRKQRRLPLLPWLHWGIDPPPHDEHWTRATPNRDLYFSVRLEQLLLKAQVSSQLERSQLFSDVQPTPEDEEWMNDKLKLLEDHGLAGAPKLPVRKKSKAASAWFKQYLTKNARKSAKQVDFAAVEKKRKVKLPRDYKEFISTIGQKSYKDVCDMEGSTTTVLPPAKLDFKDYRRGKVPYLEGDDAKVDGVMFAETDHGDCFVWDVSAKGEDYPVYWYRHEENTMEPFAPNYAECIKRFAEKS